MEEYKKLTRLYLPDVDFVSGKILSLSEGHVHYLRNVMRKEAGERLRVFNGADGEWIATLEDISKNKALIKFDQQIYKQEAGGDIWIITSVLKKEPFDLVVEKSCELGAATFMPVICDHTVVHKINRERLQAVAVEAAEQSERLDVMKVEPLDDLKKVLKSMDPGRNIIFCLERGEAGSFADTVKKLTSTPLAILIGPEGGFSEDEISFIKGLPQAHPVSLGPRILRAETALIAALAGVQLIT